MRRLALFLLWLMCFKYVHPHSDPAFIDGRPPWEQLSGGSRAAMALCNPAWHDASSRYQWVCGVHNLYGLRQLNHLWLGGTCRITDRFSTGIAIRHCALSGNEYIRTAAAVAASIETGAYTRVGVSLRMTRIRLPANFGSAVTVGSVAGISSGITRKCTAGIALGYHHDPGSQAGLSTVSSEIQYLITPNTTLAVTIDMASGLKPTLIASVTTLLPTDIRITISTGNGPELLQAGLIIPFRHQGAGATFGFNPLAGNSRALVLTGKTGWL
jgi:hypothetical protein